MASASHDTVVRVATRVPATLSREHIEHAVSTYFTSFDDRAIEARLQLFSDDVVFEDPAGHPTASGRDSLRTFFEALPTDWDVRFRLERLAVVDRQAIATATMTMCVSDSTPVDVIVNSHFVFDRAGLISHVHAFFDAESITERHQT